jgi:uncharacterized protein YjbI with pentapeptide repeats
MAKLPKITSKLICKGWKTMKKREFFQAIASKGLWRAIALLWVAAIVGLLPSPVLAQATKYYPPPLSYSHAQLSGQDFSGKQLYSAEFANANLEFANFRDADAQGAIFSAANLIGVNFHGANLTNAMLDQADLTEADLGDAVLVETILLGSLFDRTQIEGADFSDALLDGAQLRQLCAIASGVNSQTGVETRYSLGCR